ncbi:DUF4259 domain-containing protein [Ideonella sp. BN130291]|uniref:DUF4259 domain-containing protein n=1 Tax=Ideonella sp. BN130291 TaxID=3112940 RepID=UPI002E26F1AA|nr:DUF4259 domain-containing protein [Ideonella sp. BN130291]
MGTWSTLPFGNDDAADWAYALDDTDDLQAIEQALAAVLSVGSDYLESPEATEAIAAIELLACVAGRPGDTETYTEAADAWLQRVKAKPTPELLSRAQHVLDRILGDDSELKALWQESDEYDQWLASMADLRTRLAS